MEVTIILEGPHLLAQDFRVEERFGFDSHLPGKKLCCTGKKPRVFVSVKQRD
jgi:hypothetical protein